jgi:transposase-like protein
MTMDLLTWLRKQLEEADADLLREMVRCFAEALMGAEADALCGAGYGERSTERTNRRNGYRERRFDTRVGTIDLAVPKLRAGSYFPDWLLQPRRRAERALVAVVAECYLAGVSTRRVEGLVETLGIASLSKSQVSELAKTLDEQVAAFRTRPLDAGPYPYVWLDALAVRCRDARRIVKVCVVIATGVNADGRREVLGVDLVTSEDGAGWTALLRDLVARGLHGVQLVVSDAHEGLKAAIAAVLPGACWQRCRTHFARNLLTRVPKSAQDLVATLAGRSSPSPMATRSGPSTAASSPSSRSASPRPPGCWWRPARTCWPSPASPRSTGARSGRTTPRSGSTARSGDAPTWSASSPTGSPCCDWSAPSLLSSMTSGPSPAAT